MGHGPARSPTTGVTVLLTTQYLEEADQLADRIARARPRPHRRPTARRRAEGEPRRGGRPAAVRRRRRLRPRARRARPLMRDRRGCAPIEVATDGTAAELLEPARPARGRRAPAARCRTCAPTPRRRLPVPHRRVPTRTRLEGAAPDEPRPTRVTDSPRHDHALRPAFAARPGGVLHRLMLPVMLMLLFVYVFGGALDTGGEYVDYVVPGPDRAVRRLRRRHDRGRGRHRHDQRHRRPVPLDADRAARRSWSATSWPAWRATSSPPRS